MRAACELALTAAPRAVTSAAAATPPGAADASLVARRAFALLVAGVAFSRGAKAATAAAATVPRASSTNFAVAGSVPTPQSASPSGWSLLDDAEVRAAADEAVNLAARWCPPPLRATPVLHQTTGEVPPWSAPLLAHANRWPPPPTWTSAPASL